MTATQIVSAVTVTVCLLIDSVIIGRYLGVEAMSAYGLANPVLIIFNALGTMTACGVQVYLGKAMGKGDQEDCRRCFSASILMSLVIAFAWLFVVFAASNPLCILLGAGSIEPGNQVAAMTADYLKGYMLGAPFYFLSQIMVPYLQSMGKRKLTIASVVVMSVADILLDIIFVTVFKMGMFGIGLASGLSYLLAALTALGFFLKKDCIFRLEPKNISLKAVGEIIYGGNPVVVNQAFFMIRVYVLNQILLAVSGPVAIAALSVISTIGNIFFSVGLGSGSITLMLASIFYSEEDRSSIYELIHIMIRFSLRLILISVAIVHLFAPAIINLFFAGEAEVTEIAIPGLRIYMLSMVACVLTTVFKNYYQGIRRMRFTNMISFFDNVALLLPIVWLFSRLMGLRGVWIGILIAQFASLLFISAVVWKNYGKVSFSREAYSMLKDDFGAKSSDVLEMSITDMNTAIKSSEDIRLFCLSKGLSDRISTQLSLCVEEIVANTIKHGFTQDDHEHNADVRLIVDEDKCVIRIRDNCIGFDPTNYFELHKSDSPTDHIGIRMVMKMVNEIDYINSLGLNNLYMSINR